MDTSEEEEDSDSSLDDLLKALDGIEQCFVKDFDLEKPGPVELEPKTPFENVKKRCVKLPLLDEPIPPPKKICRRDPRLKKLCASSIIPPTAALPLPDLVNRADFSTVDMSNVVIPGLENAFPRTIQTYNDSTSSPNAMLDNTRGIAGLKLDGIDYDSVLKGLTILDSVSMRNRPRQSPVTVNELVRSSPPEKSEIKSKPQLPLSVEELNNQIVDDSLCKNKTIVMKPSTRDPRIRTSIVSQKLEKKVPADDLKKPTSISTTSENMSTNVLKNARKQRVSNRPSVTPNKCEKPVLVDEFTCVGSGRQESPRRVETEMSRVNGPSKNHLVPKSIPCLSSEILTKVFVYLSCTDLKNTKLVCKLWNDTCNVELFSKRHKYLCCGIYGTTSVMQTLSNSGCKYLNLEFNCVNFGSGLTEFWKRIGPRVLSLYLVDCFLGPETMCEVIVHCTEMTHLSISFKDSKLPTLEAPSLVLFKDLFKQQIKRRKLISMDIHIRNSKGWWLTNAILSNLFLIYPNVSQLAFTHHALDPTAEVSDLWSETTMTFSPVFEYISSRSDSMEKLELDVYIKEAKTIFAWPMIISHVKLTRLRDLVIEVDLQKISGVALIEFCMAQSELESVNCKVEGCTSVFMSFFLLKLLSNCTRLRNLKVKNKEFVVSYEFFRKLVFSKLESLCIASSNVSFAREIMDELEWPTNGHLRSLSLSQNVGNDLKSLFITIFRKLTSLELRDSSQTVLQLIWRFQTDLVTLKLARIKCFSKGALCSLCNIRNLRNLEYLVLEVENVENHDDLFKLMFSEFHLPRLKYLYLKIRAPMKLQYRLLKAIRNLTELEGVLILCSGISRSTWLQLSENWKKLRYLRIIDKKSQRFESKEYFRYFDTSPNLRALIHEFEYSTETFYYDAFSKRVKNKDSSTKYRIRTEKVGCSFIDWLWF